MKTQQSKVTLGLLCKLTKSNYYSIEGLLAAALVGIEFGPDDDDRDEHGAKYASLSLSEALLTFGYTDDVRVYSQLHWG